MDNKNPSNDITIINQTTEKYYELKQEGNSAYKLYLNKLICMLLEQAKKYPPKHNLSATDIISFAGEFILECLSKWSPGGADFWPYYKSTFDKRILNECSRLLDTSERAALKERKKYIKEHPELSEEEKESLRKKHRRVSFYSDDDQNEDAPIKDYAGNEDTNNQANQDDKIKEIFDVLNNAVMTQVKKYENSPKVCYPLYFYTEFVTKQIQEENELKSYSKSENGLMNVIDHDFISYYMTGDNNSLAGIAAGLLKPISTFKADDPNGKRPCGYALENVVYTTYISTIKNNGKIQSASSISQQRNKFSEWIITVLKDNKIEYC